MRYGLRDADTDSLLSDASGKRGELDTEATEGVHKLGAVLRIPGGGRLRAFCFPSAERYACPARSLPILTPRAGGFLFISRCGGFSNAGVIGFHPPVPWAVYLLARPIVKPCQDLVQFRITNSPPRHGATVVATAHIGVEHLP